MGQTSDTSSYASNTVTITYSLSLASADDDDSTGTLRVHKDDFALYNVNVKTRYAYSSLCMRIRSNHVFSSSVKLALMARHWH